MTRKYVIERLSSKNTQALEDRLNELFVDGYKLMSVTEREGHMALYSFEFIGRGYETLPTDRSRIVGGKESHVENLM